MQPGRVDARDNHVEGDVDGAGAKPLHEASRNQHGHHRRRSGDQESDDE
jgi:hypothetical protein